MTNKIQLSKIELSKLLSEGISHHQSGDLTKAKTTYTKILGIDQNQSEALHLLGLIYAQSNLPDLAISHIKKAISVQSNNPIFHNNLGLIFHSQSLFRDAISCFRLAIENAPNYAEAFNNLGNSQEAIGLFLEAISSYRSAIEIAPNYAEAFNNLGNSQEAIGLFLEAISSYRSAIEIAPNYMLPHHNLGVLFQKTKQLSEAIASFLRAINISPNSIDSFDSYICLANCYYEVGNLENALNYFKKAKSLNYYSIEAQFGIVISQIPKLQPSSGEVIIHRANLKEELNNLKALVINHPSPNSFKCIGEYQPFFLAYQIYNNKSLLRDYGEICNLVTLQSQLSPNKKNGRAKPPESIKVGIVSAHIFNHSVWNAITKGWLQCLSNTSIEVHIFYLGVIVDFETDFAKTNSSTFHHFSGSYQDCASLIRSFDLDAIIYPEICMDSLTTKIANLRIAPLQIVAWGHPETSGLPSIDFFISADFFEDLYSDEYYSEKLIKLPKLGVYLEPSFAPLESGIVNNLGIDFKRPIAISAGAPFKYSPQYDWIFSEIAIKNPSIQIVFFDFPNQQSANLMDRINAEFLSRGICPEKNIVVLPHLNKNDFYALLKKSTVFLDTIGFSGFNTALQAIECDLPIATLEGKFMRGRLGSGILKALNMEYFIAKDISDYIKLVNKLCTDRSFNLKISDQIRSRKACLYFDQTACHALHDFLVNQITSNK